MSGPISEPWDAAQGCWEVLAADACPHCGRKLANEMGVFSHCPNRRNQLDYIDPSMPDYPGDDE